MSENTIKKECQTCGGCGQINFFKGVSRFLLSTEECPDCAGLGYCFEEDIAAKAKNKHKKMVEKQKK